MSIFGDLDVTGVDDDPFSVKDGVYRTKLVDVTVKDKEDGSKGFSFSYKIEDDDAGIYNGRRVQAYFVMPSLSSYPAGTKITDLEEDDQQKVLRLRNHIRLAFGLAEEEISGFDPKQDGVGKVVYCTVKTTADKDDADKKYVNIRKVESEDSFNDKMAQAGNQFGSDDF